MVEGIKKVIIVGAGPAGLLLALRLARVGINVEVFEAAHELSDQPRATHYGPPAVYELRRAGVLDDMREDPDCFLMRKMCWRKLDGTYLAGFNTEDLGDYPDRTTVLFLNKVVQILANNLAKFSCAKVFYGKKFLDKAGQDGEKASITVENISDGSIETHEADYVVGCDGAGSQVRRSLFGAKEFPGYTWEKQIVATNTYYDFDKFGWEDSNFIIHPEHLFMAARISRAKPLWRVTYVEVNGLSRDEIVERLPKKFETMLPGHPKPEEYEVVLVSPYKIHQRCAPTFNVGRYLLAADAAHVCNPFGGLGLTGGIVDVGCLADCLIGIHEGKTSASILDSYSKVRIEKYNTIINQISTENFKRLYDQDANEALEKDDFLKLLRDSANDKELSRNLQMGANAIRHDFTAEFDKENSLSSAQSNGILEKSHQSSVTVIPVAH